MIHRIDHKPGSDDARLHHEAGRRRPEPIKSRAHRQVGPGLDDITEPPHRKPAPAPIPWKELPIRDHVGDRRVCDVVGRHRNPIDLHEYLARAQRRQ